MKQDQLTAIVFCDGEAPRPIVVTGVRVCQALRELIQAGHTGITAASVSNWALRLSEYIRVLRHDHGIRIDMQREPNSDGIGKHGRYSLRDRVQIIDPEREAA